MSFVELFRFVIVYRSLDIYPMRKAHNSLLFKSLFPFQPIQKRRDFLLADRNDFSKRNSQNNDRFAREPLRNISYSISINDELPVGSVKNITHRLLNFIQRFIDKISLIIESQKVRNAVLNIK